MAPKAFMWHVVQAVLVVAAVSGCGGGPAAGVAPATPATSAAAQPLTVRGSISTPLNVVLDASAAEGDECVSRGGYTDMAEGAQVSVTNASGTIVGIGRLLAGAVHLVQDDQSSLTEVRCVYRFEVPVTDDGSQFYGVHVGNQARGVQQYPRDDLSREITLSVG